MKLRYLRQLAVASVMAVGLTLISEKAEAMSLPSVTGDYSGTYNLGDAFPSHGLWLPNFKNGASTTWTVTDGKLKYDQNAGTLNLLGNVTNNSNSALKLQFDFSLNQIAHAGSPACGRPGCSNPTPDMVSNVKYFDFSSAILRGVSGVLSGLTLDLAIKPADGTKPPQFGYGANWVDLNFGYSNWFYWTASAAELATYGLKSTGGSGDVNFNVSPVPLPAAGWLMVAGIGSLGAMRRWRRRPATA